MNFHYFYHVTIIIILMILIGPGTVSAYYLTLEAPAEVRVGEPVNVTGTTNVPPPDKIDIVFSHSINIPVEIARQSTEITERGDTSFNVTFETKGLTKGNYKVEAISQTQRDFSAGSKNLRVVKLTDRSDIIRFSSPLFQEFEEKLAIEARIQDYEDNAIQMEVKKGETSIFGPESVPVSRGLVKYELPIKDQGEYSIIFTDYKGYIGTYPVQVGEVTPATTVPAGTSSPEPPVNVTEKPPVKPTEIPINKPTESAPPVPSKEATQQPVQTIPAETQKPTVTATSEEGKKLSGVSSSAQVSRDSPGYFKVNVKQTPITIGTSDNADWVLEYKTSSTGAGMKVNDQMKEAAEKVTISDDIKEVYLKVYPYSYKAGSEVTITADNADTVTLSDDAAKAFGAPPRYGNQATNTSGKSPAPLAALIMGIISAAYLVRRKQ